MTLKQLLKKISKSPTFMGVVSSFLAGLLTSWRYSLRFDKDDYKRLSEIKEKHPSAIYVLWHERLLMMPFFWQEKGTLNLLISAHRDGKFLADTCKKLGHNVIAGSSTRGTTHALRRMQDLLKRGDSIGMTPDGPKGPRRKLRNTTILTLAARANVPIIPAAYSASKGKKLNSWDRFFLPRPFAKACYRLGTPIHIPAEATEEELETYRITIENALSDLTDDADRQTGHTTSGD